MAENKVDLRLLREVADLEGTPKGAYNIRKNGKLLSRSSNENIEIVTKEDKPGIDIHIKPGTKRQSVHIPVYAIGGIDGSNWKSAIHAGAAGVCIMSKTMKSENPAACFKNFT